MKNSSVEMDVLIVGAGPVGLFLANECARRGLRWRIVEERSAQSEHSKALAIFPRTLEIFDMAGVVGPFLQLANRVTQVALLNHQRPLARMQFVPRETPYPFIAMVPQDLTEKVLFSELRRKGGNVDYNTKFVSAKEQEDGVCVTLDRKGEPLQVRASFVVGCDGAHSAVRHHLNLPFEGSEYKSSFLLADIETNEEFAADEMQLCPSEFGPAAIFPMSATRRRVVATIDKSEGESPSIELVRKILAQRVSGTIEARELHWSSYFRIHHRQVPRLREGRIFIAGDAAHIHSPFGGQGMNTGLQDAWNLCWKLDLFVRGHGNEELLASYSAERTPVITSVIKITDRMTKAMGTSNKLAQALRNFVIPIVTRLTPFQRAFARRLSGLGVAYRGSPIVAGPGKRYFDDSLRGGEGIGRRFLLVLGSEEDASTTETAKQLTKSSDEILEFRPVNGRGLALVRPDGYIAYASQNGDSNALEAVRSVLRRQTSS